MSAASSRHGNAAPRAATQTASALGLPISSAIALVLHALLIFAIDWPRFASQPATSIDLTLGIVGNPPATPPAPVPVPVPTIDAPPPAPTVDQPRQPAAAAAPTNNEAKVASHETLPAKPSPLQGQRVDDLVRAIADTADSATPTTAHRVFRLNEDAPKRADFAYYLRSWQRKVERIGQLNYPRQARAEGITGSLRLRVAIAADGALQDVRVLETSGHELLDEAALRIVRLAAPYAPFSPAMRETTDTLEIERTWRFLNSRISS